MNHETIAVNLDTGSYYDLNESAGYIFGLLAGSPSAEEIAQAATARYGLDAGEAEMVVDELLGKLLEEQLVVPEDGDSRSAPAVNGAPPPGPYVAPVINKYTDMQGLLLLDPVHEVDEAGWPSRG